MEELLRILAFMLDALAKAWPFLLVSIPLSVAVRLSPAGDWIKQSLGKRPLLGIVMATFLGALSPLCSCTVIPVIYGLLVSGVPLGAVMAFWLASPSMDPEIFFLSVSTLGLPLAVWRLGATFAMSLGGGLVVHWLSKAGFFKAGILREKPELKMASLGSLWKSFRGKFGPKPIPATAPAGPATRASIRQVIVLNQAPQVEAACCAAPAPTKPDLAKRVLTESLAALVFVGKFMVIAYLIEALIVLYLPQEWIVSALGSNGPVSVAIATLVGIPLYTTNLAALGLLGGLLQKGMLEGAALAFLIAGPTTTLPAMSAVFGLAKGRVFAVYLGLALVSALFFGLLKLL